jgi:HD-GYP domain-containing protein (c-di-GMP phosphodiesterase class II)
MNLVSIHLDSIPVGRPLPFSIRDQDGALLAPKGFMVKSLEDLDMMLGHRGRLFANVMEFESQRRAYLSQLHTLVRDDAPLGQIADSQFATFESASARDKQGAGNTTEPDWLDLQAQAHTLLRDGNPATFLPRLERLYTQLARHAENNPDGTLFALIHLSSSEVRQYSATHAMLVCVMCTLAARDVLKWSAPDVELVAKVALTMNTAMTELQDQLAVQHQSLTPEQARKVQQHAMYSVRLLEQLGVTDTDWLEAVLDHHARLPGRLAPRSLGQRVARLIQRADIFAARLSPRASRAPDTPASAMKASYYDENREIDEAGAAVIKAVGIYSPGSFVRLATEEVAVVIKRGANTTTPRVAVVVNRAGMPTGELIVRDTSQRDYRILASIAHRDVKVKVNLARLLALTKSGASDRFS